MDQELSFLPITILSRQLASRKLSPGELVQALIQRIEQAEAEITAGRYRGPPARDPVRAQERS